MVDNVNCIQSKLEDSWNNRAADLTLGHAGEYIQEVPGLGKLSKQPDKLASTQAENDLRQEFTLDICYW